MSEHTPGPWTRQGQWNTDCGIAECIEAKDWGIIGAWIDNSNEPDGNAQMVAAAPELLTALRELFECVMNCPALDGCRDWDAPLEKAKDAIAKATGQ